MSSSESTDGISNSPLPVPPPPPEGDLTYEDVVDFFKAVEVNNVCPVCENVSWTVLNSQYIGEAYKEPVITLNAVNNASTSTLSSYSVVLLTCTRCYYVRLHGRRAIHMWVKNGKKAIAKDV